MRLAVLIALLGFIIPQPVWSEEPAETEPEVTESKSPEEVLFFTKEEISTIATKREVAAGLAPANVTVVLHDEIVRSPALSIPEILRRVAGMDVITVTAAESDLSPRGFATTLLDGDRIAVLVDGRAVHLPPIGGTIFSALPISRYDIKRIEIIKGPMSSLYGDRAFLGTVNIITFDPEETRTLLAGGGGMYWAGNGDFLHAGSFTEKLWYKVSGNYKRADAFDDIPGRGRPKDLESFSASGMMDWKPTDKTRLRLTSGISDSDLALQVGGISQWNMRDGFVMGDVSHDFGKPGKLTFKSWWRRASQSSPDILAVGFGFGAFDSVASELRNTFTLKGGDWFQNTMTIGAEYRFLTSGSLPDSQDLHNVAGFIQDEMSFWNKLLITGGFRFDYQKDFTGFNSSAHGSIVWLVHPKYTARVSVSTAFNTPTFMNFFIDIPNIPISPMLTARVLGNHNLDSERIFYVDFSNAVRPLDWLKLQADFFYYRMKNMITPRLTLPSPNDLIATYDNQGGAEAIGGEVSVEANVTNGLDVYANWAYQHIRPMLGNLYVTDNLGNPANRVNAGVRYVSDFGLLVNVDFHWIQSHERQAGAIANFASTPSVTLGDLFLLDARVAYQVIRDHLELAIIANNIFDDNTPETPVVDPILNIPMAERPHFRLLGSISYMF